MPRNAPFRLRFLAQPPLDGISPAVGTRRYPDTNIEDTASKLYKTEKRWGKDARIGPRRPPGRDPLQGVPAQGRWGGWRSGPRRGICLSPSARTRPSESPECECARPWARAEPFEGECARNGEAPKTAREGKPSRFGRPPKDGILRGGTVLERAISSRGALYVGDSQSCRRSGRISSTGPHRGNFGSSARSQTLSRATGRTTPGLGSYDGQGERIMPDTPHTLPQTSTHAPLKRTASFKRTNNHLVPCAEAVSEEGSPRAAYVDGRGR